MASSMSSHADATRARALPYPDASRLVQLWGNVQRARVERRGASYPDYLDWRAQSNSFTEMAAFDQQTVTLVTGDDPERLTGEFVSAPYFSLLGVAPARGRVFQSDCNHRGFHIADRLVDGVDMADLLHHIDRFGRRGYELR